MKPFFAIRPVPGATLVLAAWALVGCSTSTDGLFSGEKIDYRSQSTKTQALDVPPDLTQMARDGRYQAQSGVVSASAMRQPGSAVPVVAAAAPANTVAPNAVGDVRLMREGDTRWLVSPQPPEKLFAQVRSFWAQNGFGLTTEDAQVGVLETDYLENRAKLPQDIVRRTLGRIVDSLYSTGERDSFRTRIERSASGGSEIFITHKGLEEVAQGALKDQFVWQPRARDPGLEAEFLTRLMVQLGTKAGAAAPATAAAPAAAPAATVAATPGVRPAALPTTATLQLAEPFDRAWRQVGLALDRSGFTVEDRDRTAGIYFVRYVDPKLAKQEEPNFFQRLFSSSKDARPERYRVQVKAEGSSAVVTVQNSQGEADNSESARQIAGRLIDELKR